MGTWGTGLYSGDFAADLKLAISAVARLPLDETGLVDALRDTAPGAAGNPEDEDHTIFWLVLADQFEKRGIANARVRDMALSIIDRDADISMLKRLGAKPIDLRKRAKLLGELRARVAAQPRVSKARKTLKRPEPYTMETGGVYAWPTLNGHFITPFLGHRHIDRAAWTTDGFGMMAIVDRGRAFDYLAWYRPLIMEGFLSTFPDVDSLIAATWYLRNPGTCSTSEFKRLELASAVMLKIDPAKLDNVFPNRTRNCAHWAISGIPITESMTLSLFSYRLGQPPIPVAGRVNGRWPKLLGLTEILA